MASRWDNTAEGAGPEGARGSNQSGLRVQNERLVLTLLRQGGPSSKVALARATGLSAQTVSVIMRGLEAEGFLQKCEPVRGKVGQPQVPMRLAPGGAYFLGLKVGRRSLDLVLTDFTCAVIARLHRTHPHPTADGVVRFAREGIAELLATLSPRARARVAGLGIAIPFRLWDWARPLGVPEAEMAAWRTRDIRAEIEAQWDFPVYLQNDATAACGAELVVGGADGPADFLYFFVGFFIGGGVVLNHRLYAGPTGNAGALGSMPVLRPDGSRGQLVERASLMQLEEAVRAEGGESASIWESPEGWDIPEAPLTRWIAGAAEALAQAIAAAASVIDFEAAVIDGWLPAAVRARLVDETRAQLATHPQAGIDLPAVREGQVGSDARALGAASLPMSDRFLIDPTTLMRA